MTPETVQNAKLIASVLCRVVDYYTASQKCSSVIDAKTSKQQIDTMAEGLVSAERRLAVAIENVIDAEALS